MIVVWETTLLMTIYLHAQTYLASERKELTIQSLHEIQSLEVANPLKWVRLESFLKSRTITQICDTNTNNHDNIEFHPQKHTHTQRVSCSCNEE
jgi:hypothetical protein